MRKKFISADMEAQIIKADGGEQKIAFVEGGIEELIAGATYDVKGRRRSRDKGEDEFFATRDWEQAHGFLCEGWVEGIERLDSARADIVGAGIYGERVITVHDVAGAVVDVGAYVAGEPECMMEFATEKAQQPGGLLRIVVNVTAPYHVSSDAIMQRGAAIVALVDTLEQSGKSVEVVAAWTVGIRNWKGCSQMGMAVHLKKAGEPLDPSVMAYCLGHPSFLRRHLFALFERQPRLVDNNPGYGYVCEPGEELRRLLELDGALYLPAIMDSRSFDTVDKCRKWLVKNAAECGVEVELKDLEAAQ